MKTFTMLILLAIATIPEGSFGAAKVWMVKCGQSEADSASLSAGLKAKGVNVLSTAVEQGKFRDDVCGTSGALLAIYLRESDSARAKEIDAGLRSAPEGYPPGGRKVH